MTNYTDYLYNLLPSVYRIRDAEKGGALRALLSVIERELNVVEQDIDQLYKNWFIETCEEWVVPYIGDLLDVRGLQTYGSDTFSLRGYVANTLAYRRRKGTAAVLEQLARDVTGWRARVVEFFQLLATTQHVNHIRLNNHRTPDLRDSKGMAYIDGPFDTASHTADVRNISTVGGKYNIPNIGIFLWRLQEYYMGGITARPHKNREGCFYFDPLGADLNLFNRPRTEVEIAHLAEEVNVPIPLRRRALFDDLYGGSKESKYFDRDPVLGIEVDAKPVAKEKIFICDLSDYEIGGIIDWRRPEVSPPDPPMVAIDPELGRLSFAHGVMQSRVLVSYAYGFSDDVGGGPYNRQASVNEWLKRFKLDVEDIPFELWQIGVTKDVTLHAPIDSKSPVVGSLVEAISEWNNHIHNNQNVFGVITVMDNETYDEDLLGDNALIIIPSGSRLAIVAADWPDNGTTDEKGKLERPKGHIAAQNRRAHLKAGLNVKGTSPADKPSGELVIDGLLVEGAVTVVAGNLSELLITHCTLKATAQGLEQGVFIESSGAGYSSPVESPPISGTYNSNLVITIKHCITGPFILPDSAPSVRLEDSIIGEDRTFGDALGSPPSYSGIFDSPALEAREADSVIARCTVFGTVSVRTLESENSIFTGIVSVSRRQEGCVRFCYVPPVSRTPRRYRCQPDYSLVALAKKLKKNSPVDLDPKDIALEYARVRPIFTSSRYGEAAFCQLRNNCPLEIRTGAVDWAEMGVFNSLKQPQREGNLRAALQEYLRFGLEAGPFYAI